MIFSAKAVRTRTKFLLAHLWATLLEAKQFRTCISHGEEGRVGGRQRKLMWPAYTYQRGSVSAIRWPSFGAETAETKLIGEVIVLILSPEFVIRIRVGGNIG